MPALLTSVAPRSHFLWRATRSWLLVCQMLTLGLTLAQAATVSSLFDTNRLAEIDTTLLDAIRQKQCPGGVFWLERSNTTVVKTHGQRAVAPKPEAMAADTIFDAASLTKVMATTPSIMLLVEREKVALDVPVRTYLPEFKGEGRDVITVRHLMTHTSGLKPGIPKQPLWTGYDKGVELALAEKPEFTPGNQFRYSDVNFILLGEIVHRVSGLPLNLFADREVFRPLKMRDTGFLPDARLRRRIAPTEKVDGDWLRGVVHDPTSRRMGGVAGHAGLFTTAADLARYCRMMLQEGTLEGVRLFRPETVKLMTSVQSGEAAGARRGLGWDIDSTYSRPRGRLFPLGSYGHTGFTGTCLWIDPASQTFWIFLSSRLHPDGTGNIASLQIELGTLAAEAVRGFDFHQVPGALAPRPSTSPTPAPRQAGVLNGIDVLVRDEFKPLRGLKLGLITNHTGQDRLRRSTIDLLHRASGVSLRALFSPEHGIRGTEDAKVSDSRDAATGLPVFSLYGERRIPSAEQLQGLDALVFDLQDIGARYYTYVATLGNCMEAAARSKIRFIVLDRVNPINGLTVEGPVHTEASTFVAYHRLPLRHGMTVGELARMFQSEKGWTGLDLVVVPVEGWSRAMGLDETFLPWTSPSPNMRSMNGTLLYPGLGMHEAALAVGRGTESPFQWIGAPYVNERELAAELTEAHLSGVAFLPIAFTPTYSTFKGRRCRGVSIQITRRDQFSPVDLGIEIARAFQKLYPQQYALDKLAPLLTDTNTLNQVRALSPLSEIKKGWQPELSAFLQRRSRALIYP